jgi:hypothetical protein
VAIAPLATGRRDSVLVVTGRSAIARKASVPVVTGRSAIARKASVPVVTGRLEIVRRENVPVVTGRLEIVRRENVPVGTGRLEIVRKENVPVGIGHLAIAPGKTVVGMSGRVAVRKDSKTVVPGRRAAKALRLEVKIAARNARAAAKTVGVPPRGNGRLAPRVARIAHPAASEGLLAASAVTARPSRAVVQAGAPPSASRAVATVPAAVVTAHADRVETGRARRLVDARRAPGADPKCAWLPAGCAGARC